MDHTREYIGAVQSNIYSHELVELVFAQPYCRIGHLTEANIVQRNAASRYLKLLCEIGVLSEIQIGRKKLFVHPKFLNSLTSDNNDFVPYGPSATGAPGPK